MMEQVQVFRVFAVVGVLVVLSIGNACAQSCHNQENVEEQHEFTVWVAGPPSGASSFIAGPGAGTTDVSQTGYGSLAVFDGPIIDGPDERNSTELGRCRGQFIVDAQDGTNLLMLLTFDFANDKFNGSILTAGNLGLSGESFPVPILGGTGAFASAKGFITIIPNGRPAGREIIDSLFNCEFHVTVPKSTSKG